MSGQRLRSPRWSFLAATVAAGLILVGRGPVRADDLLDKVGREQKVAAQKALADIKARLAEARKFEGTDPVKAKEFLRTAEFLLEDARGLSEGERAALAAQIQRGLKQVAASQRERDRAVREEAERDAVKQAQEAKKRDLGTQSKYNPYTKPKDFINTGKTVLGEYNKLKNQREGNVVAIGRENMRTFSGMVEERFTAHYKWVLENGKRGQQLSQAEKDLLKMLNSRLAIDFNKHTFKQVIEYLQDKTDGKMPLFIDEGSLKEVDVDYDSVVTLKLPKVTMRSVLKKILADRGLTYIIKEAAIHVMTPAKAKEYTVIRTYPVADLLGTPNPMAGQYINRVQQMQAAQQLMQLIVNTVDPASWQVNGGPGTITFEPRSMSIVIRNTAEWHYQMAGAFGK